MSNIWLMFDPETRTFSGTPDRGETITIQLEAYDGCELAIQEFYIFVEESSVPILITPISDQIIHFSRDEIWTFSIPPNTFYDEEGDTIFLTAVSVIEGEERPLDENWKTLTLENQTLSGIPNMSGSTFVRVYAYDIDQKKLQAYTEFEILIITQGIEVLELYSEETRGYKGFIGSDNLHTWISNGSRLERYNISPSHALREFHYLFEYSLSGVITAVIQMPGDKMLAGDDLGNIKLLDTTTSDEIYNLEVNGSVSCFYQFDDTQAYVGYSDSIALLEIQDREIVSVTQVKIYQKVYSISERNLVVYIGAEDGLYEFRDGQLSKIHEVDSQKVLKISINDEHLYALNEELLMIIDISNPEDLTIVKTWPIEAGKDFTLSKFGEDLICYIIQGQDTLYMINVSDPLHLKSEGCYRSTANLNSFYVSNEEIWGIIATDSKIEAVELFMREIKIEICDVLCDENESSFDGTVTAGEIFEKYIKIKETPPVYEYDYTYGLSYEVSGLWKLSTGELVALPGSLGFEKIDEENFTFAGELPDYFIGTMIDIEVRATAFKDGEELDIDIRKFISLSVFSRKASIVFSIPDQSLMIGNYWLFSFSEDTFADADTYESEYLIGSNWVKSEDVLWISFDSVMRTWFIASSDSNKETLFQCDPCDSINSEVYSIRVTAKNSAAFSDLGTSTTFDLVVYSDRIPDQHIHPGTVEAIFLDESIFPDGVNYTVHLVDNEGGLQNLPQWISYTQAEKTILMFPSYSEIGHSFNLRVTEDDDSVEIESDFTVTVVNSAPSVTRSLIDQSVKVEDHLDYQFEADCFKDPDGDTLEYSASWVKEDGSETATLPYWMTFDAADRRFYGILSVVESYSLRVYANDGLGGIASDDITISSYNNSPYKNPNILLEDVIVHAGSTFEIFLGIDLFLDNDKDLLSLSAFQGEDHPLPDWITFNAASATISGTPLSGDLVDTSVTIKIFASDGHESADTSFNVRIENSPPVLNQSLQSQLISTLDQGLTILKPNVYFEFAFREDSFTDEDWDSLSYSASLEGGNPLPTWLIFDSEARKLYGTPPQLEVLDIVITVTDGYASATGNLEMDITNQSPYLEYQLQQQYDDAYPSALVQGSVMIFQFAEDSFKDEDDSLSYTVLYRKGSGNWESLDSSWISFEGRTLSGKVSGDLINDSTISIQIAASDGFESVSDVFDIKILSVFPSDSAEELHVNSEENMVKTKLYTKNTKLAVISNTAATVQDTSDGLKTSWELEGSPKDINYILARVAYRIPSTEDSSEDKVTFEIDEIRKEYPLSVFDLRESIDSSEIPNKEVFVEDDFNLNIKQYFNYTDEEALRYEFNLLESPSSSKNWLVLDSGIISGEPDEENQKGKYLIEVRAIDEFGDSKYEIFELTVEESMFQKFLSDLWMTVLFLLIVGVLLSLFCFRFKMYNLIIEYRKTSVPLQIGLAETQMRRFFWLRKDEEKMAEKLLSYLPKDYSPENPNLVEDLCIIVGNMDPSTREMRKIESVIIDTKSNLTMQKNAQEAIEDDLGSCVTIKNKTYHAQYLLLYIKVLLYKRNIGIEANRALEEFVEMFKCHHQEELKANLLSINKKKEVEEWINYRNAWAVSFSNSMNDLFSECREIDMFIQKSGMDLNPEMFYTCIRTEIWKDTAIRIDDISDLGEIKLYDRAYNTCCCRRASYKEVSRHLTSNWLSFDVSFSEFVINVDRPNKDISPYLYLKLFNKSGVLLLKMMIISAKRSSRHKQTNLELNQILPNKK